MGQAHIGTSGFSYQHWKVIFYPEDLPQRSYLEYYAQHFRTVELNNTFYAMPKPKTCSSWRERTPEGFCFVVKLNRWISHARRLANCTEQLNTYLDAVCELGHKLGPVLVQLPPGFNVHPARLDSFLSICPKDHRWALEFRNRSWLCSDVYMVLRNYNAALVVHDLIADHPHEVTADWVYLRYHGPTGGDSSYTNEYLEGEARRIKQYLCEGLDVYGYFNNDACGYAVQNAKYLLSRLPAPVK